MREIKFDLPEEEHSIIKVIGVGGGGSNAVSHMYKQGIVGVDFAICNTDGQSMESSPVPVKIQLGPHLTEGRGAGSNPSIGKEACMESIDEVRAFLEDQTKMLFITAGMGGGTGTGAAPIIAQAAKELDILTVGIVTVPFTFEGRRRTRQAMSGLEELQKNVDACIVISNDKLREIYGNLPLSGAFSQADDILTTAAKGIAEIITVPGYVNVDFEDVNTVMRESGVAIMGTALAEGENRACEAVDAALNSPLLEDNNIKGAEHILINISSGTKEVTMDEIGEITEFVQDEAGKGTDLIWGNCYDEKLGEQICVTVIATGFEPSHRSHFKDKTNSKREKVSLDEDEEKYITKSNDIREKNNIFGDEGDEEEKERENVIDLTDDGEDNQDRVNPEDLNKSEEPFANSRDKERKKRFDAKRQEKEKERLEQLKNTKKLTRQTIQELENEPAYVRRRVQLEDLPEQQGSTRLSVTEDEDKPIDEEGNSFLHDNVD